MLIDSMVRPDSHRRKFVKKNHVPSTLTFPLSNETKSIQSTAVMCKLCFTIIFKKKGGKCFNGRKFHFYRGEYHLTLSGVRIEWKMLEVWENASSCCSCTFASMHNNVPSTYLRAYMYILIAKGWNDDDTKVYVCEKIPG